LLGFPPRLRAEQAANAGEGTASTGWAGRQQAGEGKGCWGRIKTQKNKLRIKKVVI